MRHVERIQCLFLIVKVVIAFQANDLIHQRFVEKQLMPVPNTRDATLSRMGSLLSHTRKTPPQVRSAVTTESESQMWAGRGWARRSVEVGLVLLREEGGLFRRGGRS